MTETLALLGTVGTFVLVAAGLDVLLYAYAPRSLRPLAVLPAGLERSIALPTRLRADGSRGYRGAIVEVLPPVLGAVDVTGGPALVTTVGGPITDRARLAWVTQDLVRPGYCLSRWLHAACLSVARIDGRVEHDRLALCARMSPPWPVTLVAAVSLFGFLVVPAAWSVGVGVGVWLGLFAVQRRLCRPILDHAVDALARKMGDDMLAT